METVEVREDEEYVKEAEEARQEPGERVDSSQTMIHKTAAMGISTVMEMASHPLGNEKCRADICLEDYEGKLSEYLCQLPGEHIVHMARGEVKNSNGVRKLWKLIWEMQG